jgi:hypothetical protein
VTDAGFRSAAFEDGIVVLDPVTGQLVTVAPFAQDILDLLREQIEAGVRGRAALLAVLLAELPQDEDPTAARLLEPAGGTSGDQTDDATDSLLRWVDLARHLYE